MRVKLGTILAIIGLCVFINANLVLAQEPVVINPPVVLAPQEDEDSDVQWVWGEVAGLDVANKIITLKYLDYETSEEKQISLVVNSLTGYESVKSLEEIGLKDTLSVDYIISNGKNIAKNISLEKPENTSVTPRSESNTATPENTQPVAQVEGIQDAEAVGPAVEKVAPAS